MNEAETRAELIDPKLKSCWWGVVEGSKVHREYNITLGKIQTWGVRAKKLTADYVLSYKGVKLAIVEAKSEELEVGEGVAQAKQYAEKMNLETTYSTNGKQIYSICMKTGAERLVSDYLTPDELWNKTFAVQNDWRDKSDINLIENSAEQLKQHFDKYCSTHKNKPIVMLPRPGCSNGQLDWKDVKKVIEPILTDDRFILITI